MGHSRTTSPSPDRIYLLTKASYWDEPRDAGKFSKSVILDPVVGFGGDGVPPSNCIRDGPFANYINGIGPGHLISDHCIDRQVSDLASQLANQSFVDQCYSLQNYSTAWPCMEASPHGGGHAGIGAEVISANIFVYN